MRRSWLLVLVLAWTLVPVPSARSQEGSIHADFNGDGVSDLAVGLPHEDVGSIQDAGAVSVIYGSLSGLITTDQLWTQDSAMATSEAHDHFGWALAAGDFNGDNFDDLAIGAPLEDVEVPGRAPPIPGETIDDAGAVYVLYGSDKQGLTATGRQMIVQGGSLNGGVVEDEPETGDGFGSALAAGEFGRPSKGFGADDLAVGAPLEDLSFAFFTLIPDAGAVNVLHGSSFLADGLSARSDQFWHQCVVQPLTGFCTPGSLADQAESSDGFGSSLAVANFGMDAEDDLAVGVPLEDVGGVNKGGAVNVIYGSNFRGLTVVGNQFFTQDGLVNESGDSSEDGDLFGWSLAGGDFNGDGFADLAVGAPAEDVGSETRAGAVDVIDGSSGGLSHMATQFWTQDDIGSASEAGDNFGWSLATGDFGGSAHADLAVGAPFESLGQLIDPIVAAGGVNAMYGSPGGLTDVGAQFWSQDVLTVVDDAEPDDLFGFALTTADYGNGSQLDLAIGVMLEDTPVRNAGALNVLYGGASGLTDTGNQFWHQDSLDILDIGEEDDQFGEVLVDGGQGRHPVLLS